MTKKQRNKQRQAVYQYYRKCGYTSKDASARRNQTKSAWLHYHDTGRREKSPPPALTSSKTQKAAIRKDLRETFGFNSKLAYKWTSTKESGMQSRLINLNRYVDAVAKATGQTAKEARKTIAKEIEGIDLQRTFWDVWRDYYDGTVGFPG